MAGSEQEPDPLIGALVAGKYRVERLLGKGGMGAVYQATNQSIGKRVALKFLDRDAARDSAAMSRFQREAEAASAVESAHIVHIFDSGLNDDGRPFLVLELLHGEDLRARLQRERRLPVAEVVQIATQVLRALARAHEAGIVHRDLKPDNVFLCRRDDDALFVKLVDFGISKIARRSPSSHTLTHQGMVLGTAYYMSPEQAQAFPDVDGRSDLYSLGAIMYEALAGTPPHVGAAYEAILVGICTRDAPDVRTHAPDVPEALAGVIATALRRERHERFQNAAEFLRALTGDAASSGLSTAAGARAPLPSAGGDRADYETVRGTSVRTSTAVRSKRRAARTAVGVVIATLAAFTAAAVAFSGRHGSAGTPSASAVEPPPPTPAREPEPKPAAPAIPSAAASAPTPIAPTPSSSVSAGAKKTRAPRRSGAATARPASAPARPSTSGGVAHGLQLKTTDP